MVDELVGAPTDGKQSLLVERSGAILAPDRPLSELDLRSGDTVRVVEIDPETTLDNGPDRTAEPEAALRMLTGPKAGLTYRLPQGISSVGRTSANDIVIVDPGISRRHAIITVAASSVVVTDRGSTNGIVIDGRPIGGPTAITSGQRLLLGQSWVAVDHFPGPVIPVDGKVLFDRPARTVERHHGRTVRIPPPPESAAARARRTIELLPGFRHKPDRDLVQAYEALVDGATAELDEFRRLERESRLQESPSFDDVIAAVRARTRLWERRLTDADVLEVRLGLAELPSRSRIDVVPGGSPELRTRVDRLPRHYATVDGVPATVDLGRPGGLTLRGPLACTRPLAFSLVGQLVGLNGPDQLGVVFAGDETAHWDWLKWLPHLDVDCTGRVPVGEDAGKLIDRYLTAERGDNAPDLHRPPMVVAIVDGRFADLDRLVAEGPERGIHPLILVDPAVESTPSGDGGPSEQTDGDVVAGSASVPPSSAVVTVDGKLGHLALRSGPGIATIALETCDREAAANLARLLAPIVVQPPAPPDADEPGHTAGALTVEALRLGDDQPAPLAIPTSGDDPGHNGSGPDRDGAVGGPVDLLDLPRPEDDTRLVLGTVSLDSGSTAAVFAFNPARDGSLGLVGGPGSGKSESLRTVAAAAAMLDLPPEILPQLYVLDCHNALAALAPLPTLAGHAADPVVASEVLVEIEQLLADRLLTFELAGADTLDEFRRLRPSVPLRRILVLIDDLGALTDSLELDHPGRTREVVGQLLEFGSGLGVHLVFSTTETEALDPLLVPKVGRWLDFGSDGSDPGQATVGSAQVGFAAIGRGDEDRDVDAFFTGLADDLLGRGLARISHPIESEPGQPLAC